MSRFLARALAMLAAAGPGVGFGDFGGFGDRVGSENSLPPAGPLHGVAEVDGQPERENRKEVGLILKPNPQYPKPPILACHWPLARLAALEAEGATPQPCPLGGMNWQRPCGRVTWFSASTLMRLRAAHPLHRHRGGAPDPWMLQNPARS